MLLTKRILKVWYWTYFKSCQMISRIKAVQALVTLHRDTITKVDLVKLLKNYKLTHKKIFSQLSLIKSSTISRILKIYLNIFKKSLKLKMNVQEDWHAMLFFITFIYLSLGMLSILDRKIGIILKKI